AAAVNWSMGVSSNWASVAPASGNLPPGTSTSIVVSVTATANSLDPGIHQAALWVTNLTDGSVLSQPLTLDVQLLLNGSFESYDFDTLAPANWTLVSGDPGYNMDSGFFGRTDQACLVFDGPDAPATFEQILPTKPGTLYRLSFWFSNFATNTTTPYF